MGGSDEGGGESHKERIDRELIELLNELRIALPGVQVLFAFLLTVPFSSRFDQLSDGQRAAYFVTFVLTIASSACLMAPTGYHRLTFREGHKERLLRTSNRFAIAGTILLALSMGSAALVVADLLYGVGFAVLVGVAVVVLLSWCWFGLPLLRKREGSASRPDG
jgi:predicted membrane channel-forming protein YqfA (hemolysin III family)